MGSWNAKSLTLLLRRWNDDVAALCGFLISSLLRQIQLLTSFWRVVFNNTTPLCTNNDKMMMNLIPTWKLSRQIATIYLQTTHCQFLVLFFLHWIPPKSTFLDFKSNSHINCFNSCGVQNVGGLWHRNLNAFSFTTAAWKLSRQIATIYLQTTHCQFLVLFFLHWIPPKSTFLDFKSNSHINCFNSCGVQNVGGLWHRNLNSFSFTTAVDSTCKLDYQEQGWPSCAIGINYPEPLFISTGKAPSRLENFQYGHSSKSVNYKCTRIIENLLKSNTIPSDITQSKDTLWLALCRILRWQGTF